MRFALLVAKPGHWVAFAIAEVAVAAMAVGRGATELWLPGGAVPIPTMSVLRVAVVLCAVLPLHRWPPVFARHLPREKALRATRPVAGAVLAAVGIMPAAIVGVADRGDLVFTALLFTLAVLAVVALGDYSWLAVCAVGLGATMLDSSPAMPVSSAVAWLSGWAVALACAGAVAVYGWLGPRNPGDE